MQMQSTKTLIKYSLTCYKNLANNFVFFGEMTDWTDRMPIINLVPIPSGVSLVTQGNKALHPSLDTY